MLPVSEYRSGEAPSARSSPVTTRATSRYWIAGGHLLLDLAPQPRDCASQHYRATRRRLRRHARELVDVASRCETEVSGDLLLTPVETLIAKRRLPSINGHVALAGLTLIVSSNGSNETVIHAAVNPPACEA